jgi:hypothetical protein
MSSVVRMKQDRRAAARIRMRRARERRERGYFMVVRLPITRSQLDELIDSGYLQTWDDQDRTKIEFAVQKAWADLFRLRVTDPAGGVV